MGYFIFKTFFIYFVSGEYINGDFKSPFKLAEGGDQKLNVSEGVPRQLICEIEGYQPGDLSFKWLKGSKDITNMSSITSNGISTLTLQLRREENPSCITCNIYENNRDTRISVRSITVSVLYRPIMTIQYSQQSSETVEEGASVSFVCRIDANPSPTSVLWQLNGRVRNETKNLGNKSILDLQNVKRSDSGNYSCKGTNMLGNNTSQNLSLTVEHSPVCVMKEKKIYIQQENPLINVTCEVVADPNPHSYCWSDCNGIPIHKSDLIPYEVKENCTLSCWSENEVQRQEDKCIIHFIKGTFPNPVTDCQVTNSISGGIDIICKAGCDGGLEVNYTLRIQDSVRGEVVFEQSNAVSPNFSAIRLGGDEEYNVTVESSNSAGTQRLTFIHYHSTGIVPFWTRLSIILLLAVIFIGVVFLFYKCTRNEDSNLVNNDETDHFMLNDRPVTIEMKPLNGVAT